MVEGYTLSLFCLDSNMTLVLYRTNSPNLLLLLLLRTPDLRVYSSYKEAVNDKSVDTQAVCRPRTGETGFRHLYQLHTNIVVCRTVRRLSRSDRVEARYEKSFMRIRFGSVFVFYFGCCPTEWSIVCRSVLLEPQEEAKP